MNRVKLGIHLPNGGFSKMPFSHIKNVAVEAEDLGYSSLWVADHLVYPEALGPTNIYEALTTLAALSSVTSRATLGTSILLPLRHPLLLANMLSTLDHASEGRLVLGIGVGWFKTEFDAGDVSFGKRGQIQEETIRLLRLLWTRSKVNFDGKHFKARNLTIDPKPLQKPRPEIWLGGSSTNTFKRVAKYADGWLAWSPTLKSCAEGISQIKEFCVAEGRDISEIKYAVDFMGCIKKDSVSARRESERFHLDPDASIVGSPEECSDRVQKYAQLGVETVIVGFVPYGEETESMRLFMRRA